MTVIDHSVRHGDQGAERRQGLQEPAPAVRRQGRHAESLQKLAAKPERNGLALCTFDVSRGPENKHPPARRRHVRLRDASTSRSQPSRRSTRLSSRTCQPAIYDGEEGEIVYRTPGAADRAWSRQAAYRRRLREGRLGGQGRSVIVDAVRLHLGAGEAWGGLAASALPTPTPGGRLVRFD